MSLGDHLRYLRALKGGIDTATIAREIGLDRAWPINEIEQRYRMVGDDDVIARLAKYFERPVEELQWHRDRSRKSFSSFINQAVADRVQVSLHLRSGEILKGVAIEWDLGSVGLIRTGEEQVTVVQRHAVIDWE